MVKHAQVIGRKDVSSVAIQPFQTLNFDLYPRHEEDKAAPGVGTPVLSASCRIHHGKSHTDSGHYSGPQQNQGDTPDGIDFYQGSHLANAKSSLP